jgi:hypothetical protein
VDPGLTGGEGAPGIASPLRRLLPRSAVPAARPALARSDAGELLLAFAPGAGADFTSQARVSRLPTSVAAQGRLSNLGGGPGSTVAMMNVHGTTGTATLALVIGSQGQGARLVALDADGQPTGTVSLPAAGLLPAGAVSAQLTAPALVELDQGVLGASFCFRARDGLRRSLVPLDARGQMLGTALDLGLQVAASRLRRAGDGSVLADCPQATLVRHGSQLISSRLDGGQVTVEPVACGVLTGNGPLQPAPLPGVPSIDAGADAAAPDLVLPADREPGMDVAADGLTDGSRADGSRDGPVVFDGGGAAGTCTDPVELTLPPPPTQGDAIGVIPQRPSATSGRCGFSDGAEVVHHYRTPAGSKWQILATVTSKGFPGSLYVRTQCDNDGSDLACAATVPSSPTVLVQVDGGTDLYFIVDTAGGMTPPGFQYRLHLAVVPVRGAGQPCNEQGQDNTTAVCDLSQGLICEGMPGQQTCQAAHAPVITSLMVDDTPWPYASFTIDGTDADGDVRGANVTVLDFQGQTVSGVGGPISGSLPINGGIGQVGGTLIHKVRATLFDAIGLNSAPAEAVVQGGLGDTCAQTGAGVRCVGLDELLCSSGTCATRPESDAACGAATAITATTTVSSVSGQFDPAGAPSFSPCFPRSSLPLAGIYPITVPPDAASVDLVASVTVSGAPPAIPAVLTFRKTCNDPVSQMTCSFAGAQLNEVGPGTYTLLVSGPYGLSQPMPYQLDIRLRQVVGAGQACDPSGLTTRCAGMLSCGPGGICG